MGTETAVSTTDKTMPKETKMVAKEKRDYFILRKKNSTYLIPLFE